MLNKLFLRRPFVPAHDENRMRHEGDVVRARRYYFEAAPRNLKFLLKHRFDWMNDYIAPTHRGIEVGCGTGLSREFIRCPNLVLTDFADHPWVDVKNVDALATGFGTGEFDFVVSSNMIHHVPYPKKFFHEMARILKPGGVLLIQEINASLLMRFLLRAMRHEGYSFAAPVWDTEAICTDPKDLWSANCVIPNLLFDDRAAFHREVPAFRIERDRFRECLCFINSGGVIAKTVCIPLPNVLLRLMKLADTVLASTFPYLFALQRQLVLRRISSAEPGSPA